MGAGPANEIRGSRAKREPRPRGADGGSAAIGQSLVARADGPGLDPHCAGSRRSDGDHGGGRQRVGQDHVDRQAGASVRGQGQHVVLGAGDTFRAAAVEQLTIWAERIGVEIVTGSRAAIRPAWPIAPWPGRSRPRPTSASSTRPVACRRRRT